MIVRVHTPLYYCWTGGSNEQTRANVTKFALLVMPGEQRESIGWFGRARRIAVELLQISKESIAASTSSSTFSSSTQAQAEGWIPTAFRGVVLGHASLASCALLGRDREHLFYVSPGAGAHSRPRPAMANSEPERVANGTDGTEEVEEESETMKGQLRAEHVRTVQRPSVLCASGRLGLFSHPTGAVDERAALNLLIAVRTHPSQLASRMAIRQTWGAGAGDTHELTLDAHGNVNANASASDGTGLRYRYTLVFYTGRTRSALEENEGLQRLEKHMAFEAQVYGDLLELSLLDAPANDTLATVGMMHHLASLPYRCRGGIPLHHWERLLVLFTSDDAFMNVQLLAHQLLHTTLHPPVPTSTTTSASKSTPPAPSTSKLKLKPRALDFVAGLVASNVAPVRWQSNPWATPFEEYTPPLFPEFAAGCAFLVSAKSARRLARHACDQPLLRWHDVLLTGVVRERLELPLHSVHELHRHEHRSAAKAGERSDEREREGPGRQFLWSCLKVFPITASYYEGVVFSNHLTPRELHSVWKLLNPS